MFSGGPARKWLIRRSRVRDAATNAQPSPCGRADKSLARSGSDFRGGVTTSLHRLPAWLPLAEFAVGLRPRRNIGPPARGGLASRLWPGNGSSARLVLTSGG